MSLPLNLANTKTYHQALRNINYSYLSIKEPSHNNILRFPFSDPRNIYSFFRSSPLSHSRKTSYQPVSGRWDHDSPIDFSHQKNQIVLKLCRQIRFLAICCKSMGQKNCIVVKNLVKIVRRFPHQNSNLKLAHRKFASK